MRPVVGRSFGLVILIALAVGYVKVRQHLDQDRYLHDEFNRRGAEIRGILYHTTLTSTPYDESIRATVDRVNHLVSHQFRIDSLFLWIAVSASQVPPVVLNPDYTCKGPLDDRYQPGWFPVDSGVIILCQETASLAFALAFGAHPTDAPARYAQLQHFSAFVLAHELAHALIQQRHVPFTGSNEEAADEFGTLMLLESDGFDRRSLLDVTSFLSELGRLLPASSELRSAHGMSAQRAERLRCIGIGYQHYRQDVDRYPVAPDNATDWGASDDQFERCTHEYSDLRKRWQTAFAGFWHGRDGPTPWIPYRP